MVCACRERTAREVTLSKLSDKISGPLLRLATSVVSINTDIGVKLPTSLRHCRFLSSVVLTLTETDFPRKCSELHGL